ncbi:MAG TPA: RNA 2',3'-cyclic phosphodiesterase [Acidimicrobiia bacterium]|jgi:2'-5' RNA ligase
MARAFVAVVPPGPVLDAVATTLDGLRTQTTDRARWTPRSQWHLTLRFLGDHVDLDDAAARLRAVRFDPFHVRLGGVGAFARPTRANVLWLGVSEGCAPLTALAGAVDAATESIVPADDTSFRAHLTVARFDRPADVRELVHHPDGDHVGPVWRVSEIVLMESRLGRGPAEHHVHERITAR